MSFSAKGINIKFDHSSALTTESKCVQSVHNLMVNGEVTRNFSPNLVDILSPGLSPILGPDDLTEIKSYESGENKLNFKFPKNSKPSSEYAVFNGNSSFDLELSTSTKFESSMDASNQSEMLSKYSNILNRTMNVTIFLKEIGLDDYSEKFLKAGIDIEKLLNIKIADLKGLGFQSDEECYAIIEMLNQFN